MIYNCSLVVTAWRLTCKMAAISRFAAWVFIGLVMSWFTGIRITNCSLTDCSVITDAGAVGSTLSRQIMPCDQIWESRLPRSLVK